jgi:long-subunit acyl-CoA synthetase (AMP-forming)
MSIVESQVNRPVSALEATTLCEAFQRTAALRPDTVALRRPREDGGVTWAQYADRVRRLAGGLDALGLERGRALGIMLTNRPEFHLLDCAALHLGASPFSVYNTSTPEQIEFLFANAENRIAVVERAFLPVIRATQQRGAVLDHVVLVDGDEDGTIGLDELEAMGSSQFDFEATWRSVTPRDVLTIIYTSGTTGPPKGVQITHRNMMAELRACQAVLPLTPGGRATSYLPAAHIADRWQSHYYASMAGGCTVTCIEDPRTVVTHLPDARPTFWGSVPRVWEKMKAGLEAQGVLEPAKLPEETRAAIRDRLGLDEATWLVVGAAPTPVEVLHFFADLGMPICELWGMSETSCCATINPPHAIKLGTCGPAVPGTELRLAEDGELLVHGELVMQGYRNDPARTAEAIDADGWLHTGDVAEIDDDGYVRIVDRKKELIINAAGKNMSPANIEARLKASSPLIGQAVCIGDRQPFNVALLVLDPDGAAAWAAEHGLDEQSPAVLATDERVLTDIELAVREANDHLSRVEQIKRYTVLAAEWEPGGDELTPTMKLKRKPIAEKYAREIAALYA